MVDEQYMFSQADTGQGARPKTKFVPLFSEKGAAKTVAKLPGIYFVSSKISSQKCAFAKLLVINVEQIIFFTQ